VVGVSQSGETADTLAGLRLARERGARTLGVTNSPSSQIAREVDAVLQTHAGLEMGVAATKTFTTQVVLLQLLALRLGELNGTLAGPELEQLLGEIRGLPTKVLSTLESEGGLDEIAERHAATPSQIALAWLLARSPVMLPIPGTASIDHLEENIAAALVELSESEVEELGRAAR
jgi:glucosamine--fructose-6-phosphate aminotransferase (isomerizing)